MDEALKSQVALCSPMSLFAILVVIRQAVDSFTVEQTSNRIVSELGAFNRQWEQFVAALQTVGRRIEATQKAFDTLNGQRRRGLERPLQRIEAIRQQRGLELPPEGDPDFDDPALGVGSRRRGTVRWSSDQVTWAPDLAVADFNLEAIGGV